MATSQHELPQDETSGVSRRSFLGRSAAGLGIALSGASTLFSAPTRAATASRQGPSAIGYGPLIQDPAGLLSLPEGFSYNRRPGGRHPPRKR